MTRLTRKALEAMSDSQLMQIALEFGIQPGLRKSNIEGILTVQNRLTRPLGGTHPDMRSLYDAAILRRGGNDYWLDYLRVDSAEAQVLGKLVDIDFRGYLHCIDESAIRNIVTRHGPQAKLTGDELPITRDDVLLIPQLIAGAEQIVYLGKNGRGHHVIRYQKQVNGYIFFLEEVRSGRQKLAVSTLWKVKSGGNKKTPAQEPPRFSQPAVERVGCTPVQESSNTIEKPPT